MTCSVTITKVIAATYGGGGSTLDIAVSASGCMCLKLEVRCSTDDQIDFYPLTGANSETVTAQFIGPCACGDNALITATCVDPNTHLPMPGCTSHTWSGPVACNPCCFPVEISAVIGNCSPDGSHRDVTFTVTMFIPANLDATCLPIYGQMQFGDGHYGQVKSASFTETNSYLVNATYPAKFVFFNPACPAVHHPVTIPPCPSLNCCPDITQVEIEVSPECADDCTRQVTIKTYFSPPLPGCQPEALQWEFKDKNNALSYAQQFSTTNPSPKVQILNLDPAKAPYIATLKGAFISGCTETLRTINLDPCDSSPDCPTIKSFTATPQGCDLVNGQCLRRVELTAVVDVASGCGTNAGTKFLIDLDNGEQVSAQLAGGANQVISATGHYQGGSYNPTISVTSPTPCLGQLVQITVQACAPEECNIDPPCPPPPPPPSWCLCTSCWLFSQKPTKGWCKILLVLIAMYVGMIIVACFTGAVSFSAANSIWQNIAAGIALFSALPVVTWYTNKCSVCCTACALLLAIVLAVICVIIMVIYEVPMHWLAGIFALVGVILTWLQYWFLCQAYAQESLTNENWCKD